MTEIPRRTPSLVDLARRAVLPRPLGDRPAPDALVVGERHLDEVAVEGQQVLVPGLVDEVDVLLVHVTVVLVGGAAVHRCGLDRHPLSEHVDPALLVAAGEAGVDPALGQVVEHGDLLGHPQRVVGREDERQRGELDLLRPGRQVGVEDERRHRCLVALRVEVVLGGREAVEAEVVRHHAQRPDLFDHGLEPFVVPPDRAQPLPVLHRAGHGWKDEQTELHVDPQERW